MKPTEKIIISGMAGTTFMTLYSYLKGRKENEKYVEPELLNELIDNSGNLPEIENEEWHPGGCIMAQEWLSSGLRKKNQMKAKNDLLLCDNRIFG